MSGHEIQYLYYVVQFDEEGSGTELIPYNWVSEFDEDTRDPIKTRWPGLDDSEKHERWVRRMKDPVTAENVPWNVYSIRQTLARCPNLAQGWKDYNISLDHSDVDAEKARQHNKTLRQKRKTKPKDPDFVYDTLKAKRPRQIKTEATDKSVVQDAGNEEKTEEYLAPPPLEMDLESTSEQQPTNTFEPINANVEIVVIESRVEYTEHDNGESEMQLDDDNTMVICEENMSELEVSQEIDITRKNLNENAFATDVRIDELKDNIVNVQEDAEENPPVKKMELKWPKITPRAEEVKNLLTTHEKRELYMIDRLLQMKKYVGELEEKIAKLEIENKNAEDAGRQHHIQPGLDDIRAKFSRLPFNNKVSFENYSNDLKAMSAEEADFKTYISGLGGKDIGDIVRIILKRIMTDKLATNYNMKGKDNKIQKNFNKTAFTKLHVYHVILDVVSSVGEGSEQKAMESIRDWLKGAPARYKHALQSDLAKTNDATEEIVEANDNMDQLVTQ